MSPFKPKVQAIKILSAFAVLLICSTVTAQPPRFVRASGTRFLGASGKTLVLHGINVANKNPKEGYMGDFGASDLDSIHAWGMNCIRLTIFWDGLEPQPGKINKAYLNRIAKVVKLAGNRGIYVLLDMHQDLYSGKFKSGDGAPAWATLDEGKPNTTGKVWSEAYAKSAAVQTAFDNFWANKPGPDGVGLQDHYAKVWQAVARRFADDPAVIGYDLMNEPSPGTAYATARKAGMLAVMRAEAKRRGGKALGPEQSRKLMATPEGQKQMMVWLNDPQVFRAMGDGMATVTQNFERTQLAAFYTTVARAIRQVDYHHIIFVEPEIMAGIGVPSALPALTGAQGKRDPEQAYAPHAYDITTDNGPPDQATKVRLKIVLSRHEKESRRLNDPMLIGEWGAFYLNPVAAGTARFMIHEFDLLRCGDTYWSYSRRLAGSPLLPALARPADGVHSSR